MGFEWVFNSLTFKHMDTLRKQIHSLVYYVSEPQFLDICNVKQMFTVITRNKLFWKSYLVCSDINERYDIRQASFTSVLEVFRIASNLGSLDSAIAYFLSLKARNSVNFQPICKILVPKIS